MCSQGNCHWQTATTTKTINIWSDNARIVLITDTASRLFYFGHLVCHHLTAYHQRSELNMFQDSTVLCERNIIKIQKCANNENEFNSQANIAR